MIKSSILQISFDFLTQCNNLNHATICLNSSLLLKESLFSILGFVNFNIKDSKKKKNLFLNNFLYIFRFNFIAKFGEKTTAILSLIYHEKNKKIKQKIISNKFFFFFYRNSLYDFKLGTKLLLINIEKNEISLPNFQGNLKFHIYLFIFYARKWLNNIKLLFQIFYETKKKMFFNNFFSFDCLGMIIWFKCIKKINKKIKKKGYLEKKKNLKFFKINYKSFKKKNELSFIFLNFLFFQNNIFFSQRHHFFLLFKKIFYLKDSKTKILYNKNSLIFCLRKQKIFVLEHSIFFSLALNKLKRCLFFKNQCSCSISIFLRMFVIFLIEKIQRTL
jgi:hypothetical protein